MSKPNRPARRRSSLTGSSPIQPPSSSTPPATHSRPARDEAETVDKATEVLYVKPRSPAKGDNLTDTVRVGIYLSQEEMRNARGAYLSDWQAGGQADTFSKWIGSVIDTHAARTTAERAALARPVGRSEARTGESRSFNVAADAIERMREAIVEDQAADRWPTDSAWCGDAIAAAVAQSRKRSGGTLPTPPARLPNRLRR